MKRNNSNSKLAQFKAAVAHLPFTEFNETSDSIVASYVDMGDPTTIIEVDYNPNYKGTSCNLTVYRNEIQTDSYGTYDIDEFVEQLEPYFKLGNEVSLVKQLDRRLTKLEILANDDKGLLVNLLRQELDSDNLIKDDMSVDELVDEAYNRGFADGLRGYPSDTTNQVTGYGYLVNNDKLPGTNRSKNDTFNVELDETVAFVKRKDGNLIKGKLGSSVNDVVGYGTITPGMRNIYGINSVELDETKPYRKLIRDKVVKRKMI